MIEQLPQKKIRLLSLDAFRGLTVASMLLVNNPGDWGKIYAPFKHAEWHGCTPTDLVFPFFLFISGVSVSYALGSKREVSEGHAAIIIKVLKRSLILFGLGLLLGFIPDIFVEPVQTLQTFRIPGVLQRIALVYFAVSLIFLKTGWRAQGAILVFLLVLYWILMSFVPVPGTGYANLEPETNLGAWLDRLIITEPHLWKHSRTWDPEGLLGTLPAIATGLSGVLTGTWLRRTDLDDKKRVSLMFVAGLGSCVAGLLWDLHFPINKALWTSSYVLFSSGLAIMFLAFFYWLIDIKNMKAGIVPLLAYGVNAITAFFMSGLMAKMMGAIKVDMSDGTETSLKGWIYKSFFTPYFSDYNASLAFALVFVLFWLAILWWMYAKKIIIKI
ncbi:acyltransferase family protein [Desertivirga xinjiangensis]|uniref:acyltransferase family protein n=1 Tax=Desertivirga xinjiangensis TaxID=539206 RepID=UPI00210CED76|nr:DUF5009 domain-containing protein [Pedobacter xinjiangensis]